MIKLDVLQALTDNDGITLKRGEEIRYKTGWQVADYGNTATTPEGAYELVKAYNGNCGVWLENGIYYVDHSFRITTKREALAIGRQYNQISIYGWARGNLAYCKEDA